MEIPDKPKNPTERTGNFIKLLEFLKRLAASPSERSLLEIEREVRKREREKASARSTGSKHETR